MLRKGNIMKKKISLVFAVLIVVLAILLVACGGNDVSTIHTSTSITTSSTTTSQPSTSESTTVFFDTVDENDVEKYLDTDEAYDKAGAYAIQGYASLWINGIDGDYFNVVGLPVKKLSDTLKKEFNIKLA